MPLYRETSSEFHPEFGYLVPTRKLRSTVRVALAAAMFGVMTGAIGAVVLFPRIIKDLRIERAASSEPSATTVGVAIVAPADAVDQELAADGNAAQSAPAAATSRRVAATPKAAVPATVPKGATPSSAGSASAAATSAAPSSTAPSSVTPSSVTPSSVAPSSAAANATPSGPAPSGASKSADAAASAADADKPCKEETWPYFDSKCLWGGPPKDAAAPARAAGAQASAAVVDSAPAAVNPPEQRQVAPRRKAKAAPVARRPHREDQDRRNANARAYGYGYGRYSSPYGNPFNSWRGSGYEQQRGWGW